MPVVRLQGDLHAVIVWYFASRREVSGSESRFTKLSDLPRFTIGGRPLRPVRLRSPRPYVKSEMLMVFVGGPASMDAGLGRPLSFEPPWLLFSGRWPCVRRPVASTPSVNGSLPSGCFPSAYQSTMIPMVSYQDDLLTS